MLSHVKCAWTAGKQCLELGSGSGVVGIALHRAEASHIMLTDGNSAAVQNCIHNLNLNGCNATAQQSGALDVFRSDSQVSFCAYALCFAGLLSVYQIWRCTYVL